MHVGFVGFGLIGGSIARAIRQAEPSPAWTMAAWSPSGTGPERAVAEDVLDAAAPTPIAALAGADLVILAGPPTACLVAIDDLGGGWSGALPPSAVITDVASTKTAMVARADAAGLRYIGGHPMAGLEASGYDAARADLFVDRPWVLVPGQHAQPADLDRVIQLARLCRASAYSSQISRKLGLANARRRNLMAETGKRTTSCFSPARAICASATRPP